MHDARARRHDSHIFECALAPLQKLKALLISLEFEAFVVRSGLLGPRQVDLYRVVDDQIHGTERVDFRRVSA